MCICVYYLQKYDNNLWKSVRTYTGKDRLIVLVRQMLLKCNCTVSEIDRLKAVKELNAEMVYYIRTSFLKLFSAMSYASHYNGELFRNQAHKRLNFFFIYYVTGTGLSS